MTKRIFHTHLSSWKSKDTLRDIHSIFNFRFGCSIAVTGDDDLDPQSQECYIGMSLSLREKRATFDSLNSRDALLGSEVLSSMLPSNAPLDCYCQTELCIGDQGEDQGWDLQLD